MSIKKINFEESKKYYLKDWKSYEPKSCHINTFQAFYDINFPEISTNEKDFRFVIGLLLNSSPSNKICYIHSWVEKESEVIDVTPFANAEITNITILKGDEYEEFVRQLKEARYIAIKSMTNKYLVEQLENEIRSNNNIKKSILMERLLRRWIKEVEENELIREQSQYGYKFIDD